MQPNAPSVHTFDDAQLQIYTLMHRDSYPRFLASQHFKRLAAATQEAPTATALSVNYAHAGPVVTPVTGSSAAPNAKGHTAPTTSAACSSPAIKCAATATCSNAATCANAHTSSCNARPSSNNSSSSQSGGKRG